MTRTSLAALLLLAAPTLADLPPSATPLIPTTPITPTTPTTTPVTPPPPTPPATTTAPGKLTPPVVDAKTYLTIEELQIYFNQRFFDFVAGQVAKIQLNKKVYDTYEAPALLTLRAESLLQAGRFGAITAEAFRQTAKSLKDEKKSAPYEVMAILIEKNPSGRYIQKTLDGKPAPTGAATIAPFILSDPTTRPKLLQAYFDDERAVVEPTMKTALAATSLKPLATAALSLGNLRTLEVAATGSDEKISLLCKSLAERASDLIQLGMEKSIAQVAIIDRNANILVSSYNTVVDPVTNMTRQEGTQHKQGLSRNDNNTLNALAQEADQVGPAVKEFVERLHVDTKIFEKSTTAAAKVSAQTKAILTADYSQTYRK